MRKKKKINQCLYCIAAKKHPVVLVSGIILLLFGICMNICFCECNLELIINISISLGSSLLASVILTISIDVIDMKNNEKRKEFLYHKLYLSSLDVIFCALLEKSVDARLFRDFNRLMIYCKKSDFCNDLISEDIKKQLNNVLTEIEFILSNRAYFYSYDENFKKMENSINHLKFVVNELISNKNSNYITIFEKYANAIFAICPNLCNELLKECYDDIYNAEE